MCECVIGRSQLIGNRDRQILRDLDEWLIAWARFVVDMASLSVAILKVKWSFVARLGFYLRSIVARKKLGDFSKTVFSRRVFRESSTHVARNRFTIKNVYFNFLPQLIAFFHRVIKTQQQFSQVLQNHCMSVFLADSCVFHFYIAAFLFCRID